MRRWVPPFLKLQPDRSWAARSSLATTGGRELRIPGGGGISVAAIASANANLDLEGQGQNQTGPNVMQPRCRQSHGLA